MTAEADDSQITSDKAVISSVLLPGQFVTIKNGDCRTVLKELAPESIQCVVTSPPYWGLRDYGHADQIGQEETPDAYVQTMRQVFAEIWRVLKNDGTAWLNLGDSYNAYNGNRGKANGVNKNHHDCMPQLPSGHGLSAKNLKPKDLVGIPWRVALALQADGWYLRSDIIWAKANCMPESVTDRPTRSHEYIFLLTKRDRYYYDHEAIKEPCIYDLDGTGTEARKARQKEDAKSMPTAERHGIRPPKADKQRGHSRRHDGFNDRWDKMEKAEQCTGMRNKRDVWNVAPANYPEAHFATFPPDLVKPCILAGTKPGDVVLDPFGGSGTTGMVALELGRRAVLVELNPEYTKLCDERCTTTRGLPLAG